MTGRSPFPHPLISLAVTTSGVAGTARCPRTCTQPENTAGTEPLVRLSVLIVTAWPATSIVNCVPPAFTLPCKRTTERLNSILLATSLVPFHEPSASISTSFLRSLASPPSKRVELVVVTGVDPTEKLPGVKPEIRPSASIRCPEAGWKAASCASSTLTREARNTAPAEQGRVQYTSTMLPFWYVAPVGTIVAPAALMVRTPIVNVAGFVPV